MQARRRTPGSSSRWMPGGASRLPSRMADGLCDERWIRTGGSRPRRYNWRAQSPPGVQRLLELVGVRALGLARVSNQSAISSKPSSRAVLPCPGTCRCTRASRRPRRRPGLAALGPMAARWRVARPLQEFQVAVRVAGLAFGGGAEQRRHVRSGLPRRPCWRSTGSVGWPGDSPANASWVLLAHSDSRRRLPVGQRPQPPPYLSTKPPARGQCKPLIQPIEAANASGRTSRSGSPTCWRATPA